MSIEQHTPSATGTLPWAALLALAASGFVMIMTETLPAGLLPDIADGLSVSQGAAGQLVGAYALGTVLTAIPVITATRGLRRKPLLLTGLAGFVVANAATALIDAYGVTLVVRFVAGGFSGLVWGLIPGYSRRIVPGAVAGRGLAVAMLGTPVALAVGTPLGTLAGGLVGWRWAFGGLAILAAVLLVWAHRVVPDAAGQAEGTRSSVRLVLLAPGVLPVLAVVVGWMLAHNLLYTYIAPLLTWTRTGARVDVILLGFGVSALAGIWFTGVFVDRALRRLVLGSLAGFAVAATGLALAAGSPPVLYAAVVVWGLTFGGASTQLNTAGVDAAGADRDVAASMISTVWNLAIFGGSALGGVLLTAAGPQSLPWVALGLAGAALLVAALARRHAFAPSW